MRIRTRLVGDLSKLTADDALVANKIRFLDDAALVIGSDRGISQPGITFYRMAWGADADLKVDAIYHLLADPAFTMREATS